MDETSDGMYMPAWHRGPGAKCMAKNDRDSMDHTVLIQRDVCYTAIGGDAKLSCEFASFPTWENFEAYMNSVSPAMRNFYEVIPPEASRLYIDVDLDRYKNGDVLLDEWPSEEELADKIVSYFTEFFEDRFDIELLDDLYVTCSHKPEMKYSYHIIFPYSATLEQRIVFKDQLDHYKRMHPAPYEEGTQNGVPDLKVYTTDRAMRMIGNTKYGQNRPLVKVTRVGDTDFSDGEFKDYSISIVPHGTPPLPKPIFEIPQKQRRRPHAPARESNIAPHATGQYDTQITDLLNIDVPR